MKESALIWQEDSAIWEIVAGELVAQHRNEIAGDALALVGRAREHAADALERLRAGDLDSAGHTLIGCALALGLAARASDDDSTPIENYGGELAAAISWQASQPGPADIERLITTLEHLADLPAEQPTYWELAVRAGAHAAGLSPYITRRRQRRDLV